jgi:hypothetical protein
MVSLNPKFEIIDNKIIGCVVILAGASLSGKASAVYWALR